MKGEGGKVSSSTLLGTALKTMARASILNLKRRSLFYDPEIDALHQLLRQLHVIVALYSSAVPLPGATPPT
jgi:hypothetical protein